MQHACLDIENPDEIIYNAGIMYMMRAITKIVQTAYDSSKNYKLKIEKGIREKRK